MKLWNKQHFFTFYLHRFSPVELAFLAEYVKTMSPVAKALDLPQGESHVQMGWLLPTITLLKEKLQRLRISNKFCGLWLMHFLQALKSRQMLTDPELSAAAILVPKFKTSWTSDECEYWTVVFIPVIDELCRPFFFNQTEPQLSRKHQIAGDLLGMPRWCLGSTNILPNSIQPVNKAQHCTTSLCCVWDCSAQPDWYSHRKGHVLIPRTSKISFVWS